MHLPLTGTMVDSPGFEGLLRIVLLWFLFSSISLHLSLSSSLGLRFLSLHRLVSVPFLRYTDAFLLLASLPSKRSLLFPCVLHPLFGGG